MNVCLHVCSSMAIGDICLSMVLCVAIAYQCNNLKVHTCTYSQAVSVLKNMNWSFQPSECFNCLTLVMDHLLVQPLSAQTECNC